VIRSFIVTFNKLEKDSTINLYFQNIQNILLDYKLKSKPKNKILRLEEQKTVLKPPKQLKNYNINLTESRPTISVKVPKKSVT
jgi:hypothetical protein